MGQIRLVHGTGVGILFVASFPLKFRMMGPPGCCGVRMCVRERWREGEKERERRETERKRDSKTKSKRERERARARERARESLGQSLYRTLPARRFIEPEGSGRTAIVGGVSGND